MDAIWSTRRYVPVSVDIDLLTVKGKKILKAASVKTKLVKQQQQQQQLEQLHQTLMPQSQQQPQPQIDKISNHPLKVYCIQRLPVIQLVGQCWCVMGSRRPLDVTFRDVSVNIGKKTVLQNISGECCSGELLAVMGPSGSGKTTLLNILGGRLQASGGMVRVGGEPLNKRMRRNICYVLQQDIFFTDLTLKQTLTYTALLHLPDSMSYQDKIAHVDYIIDLLDLRHCQHTIIGNVMKRGLSGGEKKRTNIACELLTNPSVMLLDEPTSGLDSSTALSLMSMLKSFAEKERKTVIVTLHQPSSQIFYMVDKLLLLCNGQVAYFGETWKVVDHFASIGLPMNPHYNPADVILEHVRGSSDIRSRLIQTASKSSEYYSYETSPSINSLHYVHHNLSTDLEKRHWDEKCLNCKAQDPCLISKGIKEVTVRIDIEKDTSVVREEDDSGRSSFSEETESSPSESSATTSTNGTCVEFTQTKRWTTSFFTQVKVLTQRNFQVARPFILSRLNWFQTVILALIAGLLWFQVGRTEAELSDIQGWMFFSTTYWMLFTLFAALQSFPSEREVIMKERASGSYRVSAYYLAKMIGELPLTVTLPSIYLFISYPMMMGNNINLYVLLTHLVMLLLNAIVAQSVGLLIGAVCMDLQVGVTVSAIFTLFTQLFGGYLATRIPPWLTWAKYLSIIHYAFENMNIIEFQYGSIYRCLQNNSRFPGCNGGTEYIPITEILNERGDNQPVWLNTTVLVIYMLLARLLTYLVLNHLKRSQ
ncbi:unnamed protein product, partial [Meganyctiphanes norvegica]